MAKEKPRELIDIAEAKRWLREMMIRRRQRISSSKKSKWSASAVSRLMKSSLYRRSSTVAVFLSFGSEIETAALVQDAWRKKKKVLIPMTTEGFHKPFFALFQKGDSLAKTKHGHRELSEKQKAFNFGAIDLVVVPGLAFDREGHRLGYGGGVYDRVLEKAKRAWHVGLFFSNQEIAKVPCAAHDRPLDAVVTEKGLLALARN